MWLADAFENQAPRQVRKEVNKFASFIEFEVAEIERAG